jgi:agmatinase
MEQSVSYGGGTAAGPDAILKASEQLEAFDGHSFPCDRGIFTHRSLPCDASAEKILEQIAQKTELTLKHGKIPVLLGGEHTVTWGAVQGAMRAIPSFGIVQFDAHGDLRSSYEGSTYSHACVMHHIAKAGIPIVQIGIRALSRKDAAARAAYNIASYDAEELYTNGHPSTLLPAGFPEHVYLTFDIDALDPSIMPATGTPEPGGLDWYLAMQLLDRIAKESKIIGFDVVEFAPIPNLHACDFTAARLVYNIMGMIERSRKGETNR